MAGENSDTKDGSKKLVIQDQKKITNTDTKKMACENRKDGSKKRIMK